MAHILLKLPDSFDSLMLDHWPQWIARFDQFHAAAGLAVNANKKQINMLLYCMDEGASAVLASTNITADE